MAGPARAAVSGWYLLAIPLALYAVALAARLVAAARVTFPPTEVSAYYVGVAHNLAAGQGLVSDAIWSYAAQPLTLPQPAFALWMPLASLLAAVPMVFGLSPLPAAQASAAVVGAALAPLTWYIARDAAGREGLVGRRATTLALGCGLVAAAFGPFLVAVMGPDSSAVFAVLAVAACCAMPLALRAAVAWRWGVALGILLGLAYLARQEAIWLGAAYLVLLIPAARGLARAARRAWLARSLLAPIVAGALTVAPWLARNLAVFGSAFPGQASENLWFTRNSDVFAYAQRPGAADFLAQGPATIVGNMGVGLAHQLVNVVLLPALPVGLLGLLALIWLWRAPALRQTSPLRATALAGGLIFLATGILFPVATLWGTFLHASGPLLVALIVLAGLGLDRFVAQVGRWRHWDKGNAWLAPLLVLALVIPVASLEVWLTATFAERAGERVMAAADTLETILPASGSSTAPVISDLPIWLAETADRPAIVLPDESPALVLQLARDFGASSVLVFGDRAGTTPTFADERCFQEQPLPAAAGPDARLYLIPSGCRP
ncbi:MAG: hypothetical protein ACXWN5_04555 [Candidatus Limnocylindrales bacterium]